MEALTQSDMVHIATLMASAFVASFVAVLVSGFISRSNRRGG